MPLSTPITVHGTRQRADARSSRRPGFSLVELLVSISIIALLVGLTLTALSGVSGSEQVLKSRNNLRQIHTWIQNYANNHKDRVVPSQFDYLDENGTETPVAEFGYATPLLICAMWGSAECMRLLLSRGCDAHAMRDGT